MRSLICSTMKSLPTKIGFAVRLHNAASSHAVHWAIAAMTIGCFGVTALSHGQSAPGSGAPPTDSGTVRFNRDIRGILSDNCFYCHGPDKNKRQADLRLDTLEGLHGTGGNPGVLVPGKPDESALVHRIFSTNPDEQMPPPESGKALSTADKELLKRWIAEGGTFEGHWAFLPRNASSIKTNSGTTTGKSEDQLAVERLDARVAESLQKQGLTPSSPADRVTLIRRLSFDLLGLPPSESEVEAFLKDESPGAYERLVDRLLASPHFGERMAMWWLDLVRYADTVGYHGDQEMSVSPFRQYVISSFNNNKPFDQFTLEQIAGDLLPNPSREQKIASGYNRLGMMSAEGGVQDKEYLAKYMAERVRNATGTWLGITLGCAECHDHKFDPFTARDFYAMAAFFADVDDERHLGSGTNDNVTRREPEVATRSRVERERLAKLDRQLVEARRSLESTEDATRRAPIEQQVAQLEARRTELQQRSRLCMVTQSLATPRTMRLLPRGNWLDESGPVVEPATPAFLTVATPAAAGATPAAARATPAAASPGEGTRSRASRLDLANWLVDHEHGAGLLTARVLVNRLWYLMFGTGLSRSLDDFGGQGQAPDHPELLDQLARELVRSGWDLKHMLRLMTTSHAYRLVSNETPEQRAIDPLNRWLSHQNRYRLPAETVRDISLAVSGLLVREVGGASAKPYQPDGYYRHLNFPERTYKHDVTAQQWRRGVYVHWQRTYLHPTLKSLDAPTREECTAERARSNTPLAALALLNDPSFVEAARVLAARLLRETPGATDERRLQEAFERVLSRPADHVECEELLGLLAAERAHYARHPEEASRLLSIGQYPAPALAPTTPSAPSPAELAAWTSIARVLLNLHETITRQ